MASIGTRRSFAEVVLDASLLARIACNVVFAAYVVLHSESYPSDIAGAFLVYALVDGVFAGGVAVAYGIAAPGESLWLPPALDAVTRAVLVALLWYGPGIPVFPVTAVLFVALVATFAAVDGFADVVEGLVIRHSYGGGMGGLTLSISGGASTIVGVALFLSTMHGEQLTLLLAILSVAHAAAQIGAVRRARRLLARIRCGMPATIPRVRAGEAGLLSSQPRRQA
jgi:hypothetical protein